MSNPSQLTAALLAIIEPLVTQAIDAELQRRETPSQHAGQLLTTAQVADQLQVSERTVQRQCVSGVLTSVQVGNRYRIKREDLPGG